MDDLIKSRIRKVLAWDFWRWTIGIFVLVALLLWMWAINTQHGRFIWLTLVPLLFLVPLYRYHRAVRMLTESERAAVPVEPPTQVPAETAKRGIRRRAKITIVIADTVLLLALAATLLLYFVQRTGPKAYSEMGLNSARYALTRALWDFEEQQARDIALFVPPDGSAGLPTWGQAVREHVQRPADVFLREHGQTTWAYRSPELSLSDSAFEARMSEIESRPPFPPLVDTIGVITSRLVGISAKQDTLELLGRTFRRVGDVRTWGVLMRRSDVWLPYCARLKKIETRQSSDPIDPVAERASTFINAREILEGKSWSMQPTARVFLYGKEIYRTPALDTTAVSLIERVQGARVELYASSLDKVYQELIHAGYFPWGRILIIGFMFSVLHTCWLWIRKLTE